METYFKLLDLVQNILIPKIPLANRILTTMEQNLHISQTYFIQGLLIFLLFTMATSYFSVLNKYIIFYLYPSYETIKAIQFGNKSDLIHWLNYWTVFALIVPIEHYAQTLFDMIPLFNIIKPLFGIWCYSRYFDGSTSLMKRYIIPMYKCLQKNTLDQIGSQAIDKLIEFCNHHGDDDKDVSKKNGPKRRNPNRKIIQQTNLLSSETIMQRKYMDDD